MKKAKNIFKNVTIKITKLTTKRMLQRSVAKETDS